MFSMSGQTSVFGRKALPLCVLPCLVLWSVSIWASDEPSLDGAADEAEWFKSQQMPWTEGAGHEAISAILSNGRTYYVNNGTDCTGALRVYLAFEGFSNFPNFYTYAMYNNPSSMSLTVVYTSSSGSPSNIGVGTFAYWNDGTQGHAGIVTATRWNGGTYEVIITHTQIETGTVSTGWIDPSGNADNWGANGPDSTRYGNYNGN